MPARIPDFSKTIFLHSQYLKYVIAAVVIICVLSMFRSLMIWMLHEKFGGYRRCKKLARLAGTSIEGPIKLICQTALLTAIILVLGLTLLEPQLKISDIEDEYEPAQLVIAQDNTISMLAEDIKPSRLLISKKVIGNLITRLKQEGSKDKIGLLRFTDIAIPAIPILTKDYNLLEYELRLTNSGYLKLFEKHGTNIWDAVTQGLDYFNYSDDQEKILIIISDGEQVAESDYVDKTRDEAIKKRFSDPYFSSVKIFLVGIGKSTEKSLIPKEKDDNGNIIEFYAETQEGPAKGQLIETAPDPAYMEEIANLVNGRFILAENGNELSKAVEDILDKERKIIGTNTKMKLQNISPWFIGATLVLLFFIPFIGMR